MKAIPIILAGLLAAGCNRAGADPRVCVSSAISEATGAASRTAALQRPRLTPADREAFERRHADACLQRWVYRLSKSPADNEEMRTAVLGACDAELAAARTAVVDPADPAGPDAWAARRATFFIVQAEAGDCPAPKV